MSFSLTVKLNGRDSPPLFAENFPDQASFQTVEKICASRRGIGFFEAFLIPTRTDSWRHFAEDFFLPHVVHYALKVNGFCKKIFQTFLLGFYDVLTLPIRMITLLPRLLYNRVYIRQTHPLYHYLLSKGVPCASLQRDQVYVELRQENAGRERLSGEHVLFVQLPGDLTSGKCSYIDRPLLRQRAQEAH